jgi:phosphoserine phosphatase
VTPAGFASVVFDCDSTLVTVEGIDELARDHADEIRALTDAAMDGAVPLEEVYGRRLALLRPSLAAVDGVGRVYAAHLVEDAAATVAALRFLGKTVRIVSGGLRPPVEAVAAELGLAPSDVAAVGIDFDEEGAYAGFDMSSPLARSGGKAGVVAAWRLPRPALLVGDGATDLEARPAVDAFAAYTAVVRRPAVAAAADVVLPHPSLAAVLALAADAADRARLAGSPWAALLRKGDALLADGGRRGAGG